MNTYFKIISFKKIIKNNCKKKYLNYYIDLKILISIINNNKYNKYNNILDIINNVNYHGD